MIKTRCRLNRVHAFGVATLIAVAACSKGDETPAAAGTGAAPATAASKEASEDLADVGEYRLTMDKFNKYFAAQRNIMMKAKDMSPAERAAMEARGDARNNNNASLDDMVRAIEAEPIMVGAVRQAGLSPREFTMIMMSMMQTAMAAGVAKMRPKDNQDSLVRSMQANPANVKFWNDNEAELTRRQNELAAEMKRLGLDEDSQ